MRSRLIKTAAAAAIAVAAATGAGRAAPVTVTFTNHLQAGLNEIDVFITRSARPPGEAYRPTPADRSRAADEPLWASAGPVAHNPFDADPDRPFATGKPLGLTLARWLAARGSATIRCDGDTGEVTASFSGLVPNGVYTMWYAFVPMPPTKPFTGALDLPLGARDGSQTPFRADADGRARFSARVSPCLVPSNPQLLAMLAIAWHSDGRTYGSSPGRFGHSSHVQIFAPLPAAPSTTN